MLCWSSPQYSAQDETQKQSRRAPEGANHDPARTSPDRLPTAASQAASEVDSQTHPGHTDCERDRYTARPEPGTRGRGARDKKDY